MTVPPDSPDFLVVSAYSSGQLVEEVPLQVTLEALAGGVELLLESITGKVGAGAAVPAGCAVGAARQG
jgi:hypothetical protein